MTPRVPKQNKHIIPTRNGMAMHTRKLINKTRPRSGIRGDRGGKRVKAKWARKQKKVPCKTRGLGPYL